MRMLINADAQFAIGQLGQTTQHYFYRLGTAVQNFICEKVGTFFQADKANALNQFIYALREPARMYVFIDGYVRISPGALFTSTEKCQPHS